MSLLMLTELSARTGILLLKSTLQDPVVGLSKDFLLQINAHLSFPLAAYLDP